jgi:hypothetical protein
MRTVVSSIIFIAKAPNHTDTEMREKIKNYCMQMDIKENRDEELFPSLFLFTILEKFMLSAMSSIMENYLYLLSKIQTLY